jgi:hypothetical protein
MGRRKDFDSYDMSEPRDRENWCSKRDFCMYCIVFPGW